jgi:subfamily B ATP-binding cassette protein MsbA
MDEYFREVSDKEWKNDLYTVWSLTRPHLLRLLLAILSGIVLSAINGAIAYLVKPSLDSLFVEKNRTALYLLPIGVFILFVFRGLFTFCNNFLMNSVGAKIVKTLRQGLYEKLLRLPVSFYQDRSSGSIISRLLNDIGSLENSIAYTAKNFFVQLLTVVFLAGVALYRRWDLALLSFIVIPLVVVVSDRFGRRMKKTSLRTRKLISDVTKVIHETLTGIKVIKAFLMEKEMQRRNLKAVTEHYRNVMREVRINEFTTVFMEIIGGAGIAIILYYGSFLILKGELTIGSFFSFVTAILMIYTPLKRLSRVNNHFQTVRTALQRIREVYKIEDEKSGNVVKDKIRGHIVIRGLTFRYPGISYPVLQDINLEIMPGEKVAIVGYSGAGKSTLADLILGFWHNYEGSIEIDGTELRDYDIRSLRANMAIVSQDIILFDDTVRNNILFGRIDATEDEIIKAAETAYAHEFIIKMPRGYDTFIGERGLKLSGGQKQRIAIARAVLRDPKVLILDEATSSLDAESEAKVQMALERIMPGRTTIIIAHRLSTIMNADRIIVMDRGRIIESGRHQELYNTEGLYKQLYDKQFSHQIK